ncbi:hypothetical protein IT774_05185 [Salinimonas marina]|uniref:Tip attachment protein J domain-containing protein n=1 Tax=Salinimonas marina TaxID=2785918 RepID=A0A7S9DZ15_9ALTE|nr:phage tail protein [Salinimonas marina]QPG06568.1 hypothetical protein IT774_05185 [Salinimonas marina]
MGGNGTQRADTESTWAWSDNPILCALDYMRFFGYKPVPLSRFNIIEIMRQAERCDELVPFLDDAGVTQYEKRYTCNGTFEYDEGGAEVLQTILNACSGRVYRAGGLVSLVAGGYAGIPTLTLTEKDLVGQVTFRPNPPTREKCNAVRGSFCSPDAGYAMSESPIVTVPAYQAEDGIYLESEVKMPFTTSVTAAQRLQKNYLERKRAAFVIEMEVGAVGLMLHPGAPVRVTLDNENLNQVFVVQDWRFNPAKKTTQLTLLVDYPEIWTDNIYQAVAKPTFVKPDNSKPGDILGATFTGTPDDSWRIGVLTIESESPAQLATYTVQLASASGTTRYNIKLNGNTNEINLQGLATGSYGAYIKARGINGRWSNEKFVTFTVTDVFNVGAGVTITDNGNGTFTVNNGASQVTFYDKTGQPIPTITDNGNGTYTINNNAGDVVTVYDGADGYTPQKNTDYFDGTDGAYVSTIFKVVTSGGAPAAPTGGSFNGTTETVPTGWTDKSTYMGVGIEYKSTVRYYKTSASSNYTKSAWSTPAIATQIGVDGEDGLNIFLSNENTSIPTDMYGDGGAYPYRSTVKVLRGGNDETSQWTIIRSATTGITTTLDSGVISVTAMSIDEGIVTVTATRSGYTSLVKEWNISKAKRGEEGLTPGDIAGKKGQMWGFSSGLQGWTLYNYSAYSAGTAKVTFVATTDDPYMQSPVISVPGATSYAIRVRVRCQSPSHNTSVAIYWQTTARKSFTESYKMSRSHRYKQGEWTYLVFDLRDADQADDWLNGTVYKIRLDFANSGATGKQYQIDGVVIGFFGSADQTDYSDNAIANTAVTINSNGTLMGAGGGQATLGGLGFSGDTNARYLSDFYLDGRSDTRVTSLRPEAGWRNNQISIGSNGLLANAGGGQVSLSGIGFSGDSNARYLSDVYLDGRSDGRVSSLRPDTTYKNSRITIGSNGLLANAGGGQVSLSGIGFSGDSNARYISDATIDGRANNRVTALRPDTTYKNSQITISSNGNINNAGGGSVSLGGLGFTGDTNARYISDSTIDGRANNRITSMRPDDDYRNFSGGGLNFLPPQYYDPPSGVPLGTSSRMTTGITGYKYGGFGGGNHVSLVATGADAYVYFAKSSTDYNMQIDPCKRYIVSALVKNNSDYAAFDCAFYIKTSAGNHYAGTWKSPGAQSYGRVWTSIQISSSDQSTTACLRIDIDTGAGRALVISDLMVELATENGNDYPSPYVPPLTTGRLIQQRLLPMVNTAGASAAIDDNPLSASDNGTSAKISVAAHTIYMAEDDISYNSGSITGLSFTTTYYVYCDDPFYLGGSVSYKQVTASGFNNIVRSTGRRYIGSIRTPSDGGGTTTPPINECPHADVWLTDTLQARDVKVGDVIDGITANRGHKATVTAVSHHIQDVVKITTESGHSKTVSCFTPIDREDGSTYSAINAMGEVIQVEIDGQLSWSPVKDLVLIPEQPVVRLSLGGISFLGGDDKNKRMVTHNAMQKK